MPLDKTDISGNSGDREKVEGNKPNPKGQPKKDKENPGWGDHPKEQNDGWQNVGRQNQKFEQQQKFDGQQQKFGGQEQKKQETHGWDYRQEAQSTKTRENQQTVGSLRSSTSSTSGTSGWHKVGDQQKRTQGNQQQGNQYQRTQGGQSQQTSGSRHSSSSSFGWQKVGDQQQRTQGNQQQGNQYQRTQGGQQQRTQGNQQQGNQYQRTQGGQQQRSQGNQQQGNQYQRTQGGQSQQTLGSLHSSTSSTSGSSGWQKVGDQQKRTQGNQQQGNQQQRTQEVQQQRTQGNQQQGNQHQRTEGAQQQRTQGNQQQGNQQQGNQQQGNQQQGNQQQRTQGVQQQRTQGNQHQGNQQQGNQQQRTQGVQQQRTQGVDQQKTQGAQGWGGQQGWHQDRGPAQLKGNQPSTSRHLQSPERQQMQRPQGQQMQRPQGQQMQRPQEQQMQRPQEQQMQRPQEQQQKQFGSQSKGPEPQSGFTPNPIQQQDLKLQNAPKVLPQQQPGEQPKEQRSRTVGQLPPRPAGIIKRGTIGKPGQVAINYLDINMDKMPQKAFHYDVKIEPERPKKFWRQAFEQFRVNQLRGAIAAYDGRALCYSVDRLDTSSSNGEVTVLDRYGRPIRYVVEIKETGDLEIDLNCLRSYMSERIFDKPMRAMQCLEVVMASPCHNKAVRAGRSYFKMSAPGNRRELEDGYEALIGLYQSFVLGDRPFLNVDISHKSFPMDMSVLEYLERFGLRQKIDQSTDLSQSRGNIEAFLKDLNVIYTPPKCFDALPHCWRVNGLSRNPASKQTFQLEGQVLTVAEYFKSRNYKLQFPHLHCLSVGPPLKNIMVPIELCHIEGGQPLNRKDGATQVSNMIKYAATSTNERKGKIMELLKFFKHNLDPTIARFGIRIDNDFILVHTRTLMPPQVEYQGNKCASVKNGAWRLEHVRFLKTKQTAHKWAVLYYDSPRGRRMPYNQVADFEQRMLSHSRAMDVCLNKKAEIRPYRDERSLDQCFADLRGQCDLAFVIIPQFGVTYSSVKQKAELQYGILTQCIKQYTIERKLNGQTIGNILLKVNSKLNGLNHKLKDDPRQPMLRNAMFLGADVSHPSPDQREIPSVVGVAASHDHFGGAYNMQYRLQRSTLEEIEDMESITLEHLRVYKKYHNEYPDHILYYRDGVSDGQFPKIKHEELRGIEAACRQIGIKPKICCIIVVKRHHTRFFPVGEPLPSNRFNNVCPGTVVDRTIVHPNEVQFFMVSHQAIQGTAKPTRYNVIENTGRLDIDLLQQLTFNLCHMFPRCTRSVSYPAPAYLAHLVAARGRHYLTGTDRFHDLKKEYNKRKIVADFMNTNPMFFV